MPHCSITLDQVTCLRAREASGDNVWLRWAFHVEGSRVTFHRRPQSGHWTLQAGGVQTLADQVVNQSIFESRRYWFHLEAWTDDSGLSLAERLTARSSHLLKSWGPWALVPGAGIVAIVAALLGAGRRDIPMGSMKVPVKVEERPGQPPAGIGTFVHSLSGHAGGTQAQARFTIVVT